MNVASATAATSGGTGATSFSDTTDFMTLLVAQLQAQDPLNPMDSSQFMSQLADLQSVIELQNISSLLAYQSGPSVADAVSMIGRTVEWADPATGETLEGVVERVTISGGSCLLVVGDTEIALGDVLSVSD